MTVGVVLGAGGPTGWAYHLGVLQGVRDAIGREPANADRVIGTSAGAAIAAALLAGTPMDEVVEMISSPPTDDEREQVRLAGADLRRRRVLDGKQASHQHHAAKSHQTPPLLGPLSQG